MDVADFSISQFESLVLEATGDRKKTNEARRYFMEAKIEESLKQPQG